MGRDRLQEFKDKANKNNQESETNEESKPLFTSLIENFEDEVESFEDQQLREATSNSRVLASFFQEVEVIEYEITKFADLSKNLQTLRYKDLHGEPQNPRELSDLEETVKVSMSVVKKKLYALTIYCNKIPCSPGDAHIRKSQMSGLKKKFLTKLEVHQKMELAYQTELKAQFTRQFRIANPEATTEELELAIDSGDSNFFTVGSSKYSQGQQVLNQVQGRHIAIKNIEKNLTELHQLYIDMQNMMEIQDQLIDNIEDSINNAETNMQTANHDLDAAVVSSKRARKMKIWIASIATILLLAIALSIGLHIYSKVKPNASM